MYTIPDKFDINRFIGENIYSISYGLNLVSLYFDKGYIQFSGRFSFTYLSRTYEYEEVYPVTNDMGLLRLLERKIVSVQIDSTRTILKVEFDNGDLLNLIGKEAFESYNFKIDDEEII